MKTGLAYVLIAVVGVTAVTALLLFTPLGDRPLSALFGLGDVETIDFADLKLTDKPNQFLVCPPDLCAAAPHAESPVFDVSAEDLRAAWREVLAAQPRVELLAEEGLQSDYLERSARFRFPDIITVRFIALSPSRSTLAVYSRSLYGKSDLGVNRARIEAWLKELHAAGPAE